MPNAYKDVVRDTNLPLRTFVELRDRLDALVLLLGRPARASLMEFYLARAIEGEERGMGLLEDGVEEQPLAQRLAALKALPQFQSLSNSKRAKVVALYRRVWGADRTLTPGKVVANYGRKTILEIDGLRRSVQEWSKVKGAVRPGVIAERLNAKWPAKEAVFEPMKEGKVRAGKAGQKATARRRSAVGAIANG